VHWRLKRVCQYLWIQNLQTAGSAFKNKPMKNLLSLRPRPCTGALRIKIERRKSVFSSIVDVTNQQACQVTDTSLSWSASLGTRELLCGKREKKASYKPLWNAVVAFRSGCWILSFKESGLQRCFGVVVVFIVYCRGVNAAGVPRG